VSGTLFVVATPLGHLEDLSSRALETLRSVELIACEDTRRTSKLLAHYEIRTSLVSCHRFNEGERLTALIDRLRRGADLALVTDGGTPAVSDPGALLIHAAVRHGIEVRPVPGPSAVTALLSVCGFDADRFVFDGFLPHRGGERRRRLRELKAEPRTVVLFETPHRIREALLDIHRVLGTRPLVLGREMTKLHETILRGSAREILDRLGEEVRGEITLAVAGARHPADSESEEPEAARTRAVWRRALEQSGNDRRAALRTASRELGVGKAALQRLLMELGEDR
jgi:16S rRNA (cytidine1402-2'-O)-methyltransferase